MDAMLTSKGDVWVSLPFTAYAYITSLASDSYSWGL